MSWRQTRVILSSSNFSCETRKKNSQELVDTAHAYGLTVLMDLVHSHCSSNQSSTWWKETWKFDDFDGLRFPSWSLWVKHMIFMGEAHIESYRIIGSHVGLIGTDLASMIETCGRCLTFFWQKEVHTEGWWNCSYGWHWPLLHAEVLVSPVCFSPFCQVRIWQLGCELTGRGTFWTMLENPRHGGHKGKQEWLDSSAVLCCAIQGWPRGVCWSFRTNGMLRSSTMVNTRCVSEHTIYHSVPLVHHILCLFLRYGWGASISAFQYPVVDWGEGSFSMQHCPVSSHLQPSRSMDSMDSASVVLLACCNLTAGYTSESLNLYI